jgi:hypothetical protein
MKGEKMPTETRRFTAVTYMFDDDPCSKEVWADRCEPGEIVLDVHYSDKDDAEISSSSMLIEVVMGTAE